MRRDGKANVNRFIRSQDARCAFHMSWFAFFLLLRGFGIALLADGDRAPGTISEGPDRLVHHRPGGDHGGVSLAGRTALRPICVRLTYLPLDFRPLPVMGNRPAARFHDVPFSRGDRGWVIGAAFVITQYHTSVMFSRLNCIGTANATTAGWGQHGGGVTQMVTPMVFTLFATTLGLEVSGWRLAMIAAALSVFRWASLTTSSRKTRRWETSPIFASGTHAAAARPRETSPRRERSKSLGVVRALWGVLRRRVNYGQYRGSLSFADHQFGDWRAVAPRRVRWG